MKYLTAIAAAFALGVLVTAAGVPMGVHYINHDAVASTMVKGGQIISDNGLIVLANRAVQRDDLPDHIQPDAQIAEPVRVAVVGERGALHQPGHDLGRDTAALAGDR